MKTKAPAADKKGVFSKLTTFSQGLLVLLALTLFTTTANAAPPLNPLTTVYVVGLSDNGTVFGYINLVNGAFHQTALTEPLSNLVWWHSELLSLSSSDGNLVKIDPQSGDLTVIGPTGLGANAFSLGELNGKLYLTDFSNNIYSVNPHTGAATLMTATGMPPDPNVPFTFNPDGTFNLCDESFYGIGGSLYATFDSLNVDPVTAVVDENPADATVSPALYRINPKTGEATLIGPTDLGIGATFVLDGFVLGFESQVTGFNEFGPTGVTELIALDLNNGKTKLVRNIDPTVIAIFGAAPILPLN